MANTGPELTAEVAKMMQQNLEDALRPSIAQVLQITRVEAQIQEVQRQQRDLNRRLQELRSELRVLKKPELAEEPTSISEDDDLYRLGLNNRVHIRFLRLGIRTVGQLLKLPEEAIPEIRMLSDKSLAHVNSKLEHYGLEREHFIKVSDLRLPDDLQGKLWSGHCRVTEVSHDNEINRLRFSLYDFNSKLDDDDLKRLLNAVDAYVERLPEAGISPNN